MADDAQKQTQWLEAIARTLAFFAVKDPTIAQQKLLEKVAFLSRLGFTEKAAAEILGTTTNSLGVLRRKKAKKKGKTKRGKKKGK